MFRAASLCAFMALIFGVSCLRSQYRQQLRKVDSAVGSLQLFVDYANTSSVVEPDVQKLVVLSVVRESSLTTGVPAEIALIELLGSQVPKVLSHPESVLKNLQDDLNHVSSKLKPLSEVVDELCANVPGNNECDRLLNKVVPQNQTLAQSADFLERAASVADELLAREPRLDEVAESLDVIPYVVSNKKDIATVVKKLPLVLK